jgi:hypothetical protein
LGNGTIHVQRNGLIRRVSFRSVKGDFNGMIQLQKLKTGCVSGIIIIFTQGGENSSHQVWREGNKTPDGCSASRRHNLRQSRRKVYKEKHILMND